MKMKVQNYEEDITMEEARREVQGATHMVVDHPLFGKIDFSATDKKFLEKNKLFFQRAAAAGGQVTCYHASEKSFSFWDSLEVQGCSIPISVLCELFGWKLEWKKSPIMTPFRTVAKFLEGRGFILADIRKG